MASRRLPPLNALRAFEAAARRRSISRAAEELGVTHGAVSHQIRLLESFVGTELLERAGNRFKLTVAGEQLLAPLSSGFDMLMSAVISLDTPSVRGDVTVSAPPALTCLWLVKTVGELLRRHPDLRLHLRPSNSPKEVIASDVDLCIRYGDGIWSGRRSERLTDTDLFPVCSPDLFKSGNIQDLAHTFLLCAANGHEWDLWLAAVPQGSVLMGGRHYLGNHLAMIEAATGGLGLAMGDSVTCWRYLETGALVRPFPESVRAPASFLIDAGEHERRPAVTAVRQWIRESFGQAVITPAA
jgi:LysR family glycine cleavage system transcriptional activator